MSGRPGRRAAQEGAPASDAVRPSRSPPSDAVTSLGRPAPILRHVVLAAVLALVAATAVPTPAAAALPAWAGGIDLYRSGVFTTQKTWRWCTAADVQIMRNIVAPPDRPQPRRPAALLHLHARPQPLHHPGHGRRRSRRAGPRACAATWTTGTGSWRSAQLRGRAPVGRHGAAPDEPPGRDRRRPRQRTPGSWSGSRATADPATDPRFTVTSVRVVGPLWGLQSRTYGYDMRPNKKLTRSQFASFFTPWHYARDPDGVGGRLGLDPADRVVGGGVPGRAVG